MEIDSGLICRVHMTMPSEVFRKASGNKWKDNQTVGWLQTVISTLIV